MMRHCVILAILVATMGLAYGQETMSLENSDLPTLVIISASKEHPDVIKIQQFTLARRFGPFFENSDAPPQAPFPLGNCLHDFLAARLDELLARFADAQAALDSLILSNLLRGQEQVMSESGYAGDDSYATEPFVAGAVSDSSKFDHRSATHEDFPHHHHHEKPCHHGQGDHHDHQDHHHEFNHHQQHFHDKLPGHHYFFSDSDSTTDSADDVVVGLPEPWLFNDDSISTDIDVEIDSVIYATQSVEGTDPYRLYYQDFIPQIYNDDGSVDRGLITFALLCAACGAVYTALLMQCGEVMYRRALQQRDSAGANEYMLLLESDNGGGGGKWTSENIKGGKIVIAAEHAASV